MRPTCQCFSQRHTKHGRLSSLHRETQDTDCESWQRLLHLIDLAVESGVETFVPLREFTQEQRADIVTLPPKIAELKSVKNFCLYGSCLTRIPPEIGEMESLESFDPYTSYFLHWFPYEITRCAKLKDSRVSTRAIYGNLKFRPPFPHLYQSENQDAFSCVTPKNCSICNAVLDKSNVYRRWISTRVGTDVLPLLVNACSMNCIDLLPPTPENYVDGPHTGGHHIQQPPPW